MLGGGAGSIPDKQVMGMQQGSGILCVLPDFQHGKAD